MCVVCVLLQELLLSLHQVCPWGWNPLFRPQVPLPSESCHRFPTQLSFLFPCDQGGKIKSPRLKGFVLHQAVTDCQAECLRSELSHPVRVLSTSLKQTEGLNSLKERAATVDCVYTALQRKGLREDLWAKLHAHVEKEMQWRQWGWLLWLRCQCRLIRS